MRPDELCLSFVVRAPITMKLKHKFQVRISDSTLNDTIPRIIEADLQVSRHRVSVFLSSHTAYDLFPESGKVVALDVDLPVKQAFHILHKNGIYMASLYDSIKRQFVDVLSLSDFIVILREIINKCGVLLGLIQLIIYAFLYFRQTLIDSYNHWKLSRDLPGRIWIYSRASHIFPYNVASRIK